MVLPSQALITMTALVITSIAQADINGDGFDDLVVSGKYSREAHVIFGTKDKFDASFDLTSLDGKNGFTIPDIAGVFSRKQFI